jgi:NADH-quinone oxidoreductase subunit N
LIAMSTVLTNFESLRYVIPEASLAAGVIAILVWDLVAKGRARFAGAVVIALVSLAVAGAGAAKSLLGPAASLVLFGGQLAFDPYGSMFRLIFAAITAMVLLAAIPTREARRPASEGGAGPELVMLLLVVCLGMNLMAIARSLLMIYLSIEIVSVISFVMAGYRLGTRVEERRSQEAALKYVVFGGVSSGVMVYGMSWIYGLTRSMSLPEIAERTAALTREQGHLPNAMAVGAACVLAGFAYKISAVPFHAWAPDVYEGAPTIVSAFLSIGPKAAGFAVLVRFFHDALAAQAAITATPGTPWPILGGLLAVATMTVGNLSALAQKNLKRLLAFSSIAHAGYMLLAFSVFNDEGIAAIVFYIVTYCAMNLGAFLVVMAVAEKNGGDETIDGIRGLGTRAPAMAAAMAIFLFSLVGLPPFAGFVGKVYIFAALLRAGGAYQGWYLVLAAIGVVNTVVSLFYYARVLRAMYLEEAAANVVAREEVTVNRWYGVVAAALVLPTIGLGLYWGPVYDFVVRSLVMVQ